MLQQNSSLHKYLIMLKLIVSSMFLISSLSLYGQRSIEGTISEKKVFSYGVINYNYELGASVKSIENRKKFAEEVNALNMERRTQMFNIGMSVSNNDSIIETIFHDVTTENTDVLYGLKIEGVCMGVDISEDNAKVIGKEILTINYPNIEGHKVNAFNKAFRAFNTQCQGYYYRPDKEVSQSRDESIWTIFPEQLKLTFTSGAKMLSYECDKIRSTYFDKIGAEYQDRYNSN